RKNLDKGFYEYQAYFLAARGITEFRDYFRADKIVKQIIKWVIIDRISLIEKEAKSVLQQTDRRQAIAALVQLLQSNNVDDIIRWKAAESLAEIDPDNEIAIAALVQMLPHYHDSMQTVVAESLGKIGAGNKNAIAALVQLLQSNDEKVYDRWQAAESLGNIDPG
ncbi:MAG: HEAT repeat domain-containing protein, partial [Nostoc sp.]